MTFSELRIGQKVWAGPLGISLREPYIRLEVVAFDWAVGRDENGKPIFIDKDDVQFLKPWEGE